MSRYSANAESKADSTIAKVAKHDFATIKLNRTKCQPLKASSGGGYIRGSEWHDYEPTSHLCVSTNPHLQIQTPPPYKKTIKEKIKNLESKKHRYFAYAQYDKAIKQEKNNKQD